MKRSNFSIEPEVVSQPGDLYRLRRLMPFLKRDSRVLEIGCSIGNCVAEVSKIGVDQSIGVELSRQKASLGRKLGRDVRSVALHQCNFEDQYFDVVHAHHTLEHIPDLIGVLEEINRILKAGGILYLTQPRYNSPFARSAKWIGWFPQEHLWHFSEDTLFRLLGTYGFELKDYRCILTTEYATAAGILYPAKRFYKDLIRTLGLGDIIDAVFVKS